MRGTSALAVAAVAGTFALSGCASSPRDTGGRAGKVTPEKAVATLLGGVPQRASALGDPAAPVTLQWFGDLQCPYCKEFALGALPPIIGRWVRTGRLRIVYRSLRTATRPLRVFHAQQIAALAAGEQGRLWNFIETFYAEQRAEGTNYVTERYLQGIASQIPGLSLSEWMSDRAGRQLAGELVADREAARSARLDGTPAFLIGRTGARRVFELAHVSLTSPSTLNAAIERLLGLNRSPALPPSAAV
ncbi:MAG TPA: thioredoxin domain-containing protein [Solirubrobacteraceae bacterium]|jgi:protein-disulfide isomerase|nr:thioredoxin domain-containing protein [Solirubrobacteraceae bacterium]